MKVALGIVATLAGLLFTVTSILYAEEAWISAWVLYGAGDIDAFRQLGLVSGQAVMAFILGCLIMASGVIVGWWSLATWLGRSMQLVVSGVITLLGVGVAAITWPVGDPLAQYNTESEVARRKLFNYLRDDAWLTHEALSVAFGVVIALFGVVLFLLAFFARVPAPEPVDEPEVPSDPILDV